VFLNGHEAFDFERGLAPEVEGQPGNRLSGRPPLRREADYLLRRMRALLKEFGTDLPNAVRVDQFYTMAPAVSAYHLARFAEFGSYIPPSTSIIMERCFTARTNIHTSMIAVVPGEGYDVDKFTLPGKLRGGGRPSRPRTSKTSDPIPRMRTARRRVKVMCIGSWITEPRFRPRPSRVRDEFAVASRLGLFRLGNCMLATTNA
jgi:hypothetical protein